MSDEIQEGLTDDLTGLARFGRHPDPAIDFCIQVETLESRLHQATHDISKPGDEPETVANVLAAIERALDFRVGGDEGAVKAKSALRDLEQQARSTLVPAPAVPDDVAETAMRLRGATFTKGRMHCGIIGQTIEAAMRSTFHEVSAWDLIAAADALEAQAAELAQARRTAEFWKANHLRGNADIDSLTAELARLTDALQNVMGHIDTPIGRRRLNISDPHPEWLTEARSLLDAHTAAQPAPDAVAEATHWLAERENCTLHPRIFTSEAAARAWADSITVNPPVRITPMIPLAKGHQP